MLRSFVDLSPEDNHDGYGDCPAERPPRSGMGQALHRRLDSATASPSDLDALPTETWLATSVSGKGMDQAGTAAGRREARAVGQMSSRENLASFCSCWRLSARSMRSAI
jgi:hypothetical protein